MLLAVHYRVMEYLESLESTQEATPRATPTLSCYPGGVRNEIALHFGIGIFQDGGVRVIMR